MSDPNTGTKAFLKRVLPVHLSRGVSALGLQMRLWRRQRLGVRRARALARAGGEIRLELGGGAIPKPGWTSVDAYASAGLTLDLSCPLPLPDESVTAIYSEHLLEHLKFPEDLPRLLAECRRVLKPGSLFTAGVPDVGPAMRVYARGGAAFYREKYWCNRLFGEALTPMDELGLFVFSRGHHATMFDAENIALHMETAGFTGLRQRPFDPATDRPTRAHQTVYLQATREAGPPPDPQQVRSRHIQRVAQTLAKDPDIEPDAARLPESPRNAALRLCMLASGGHGPVLLLGERSGALGMLWRHFRVPGPAHTTVALHEEDDHASALRATGMTVVPPERAETGVQDSGFGLLLGLAGDAAGAAHLLEETATNLKTGYYGLAYLALPAESSTRLPPALHLLHRERVAACDKSVVVALSKDPAAGQ